MLPELLPYLRCPVCHRELARQPGSLHCPAGHTFDVARQGYVHLAAGKLTHPGDTAAMVAARSTFLASGGYDFIATALATAVSGRSASGARDQAAGPSFTAAAPYPGLIVDLGGGTGYHLARLLDALPATATGLIVDVSKPALRRAARAHPHAGAVLADIWRGLPVPDGAVSVALTVFAPRNPPELHRILSPDGILLTVTPAPAHLAELRPALTGLRLLQVDPTKPDRLTTTLTPVFHPVATTTHTNPLQLPRPLVRALVEMGPSAPHVDPAELARAVADLPEPLPVTASVELTHWRPR